MAPPDKEKGKQDGSDGNDDGSGGRSHPCDGSGSPSAADQDHKACDEHTAGELSCLNILFSSHLLLAISGGLELYVV